MSDAQIRRACEASWPKWRNDCSGFAKAVASAVGVQLEGDANQIADTLRGGGDWRKLADGVAAAASARDGKLVIAGLRGDKQQVPEVHGHVVVVVDGDLNRGQYPTAYWGSLRGTPALHQTINWAWTPGDRDNVSYAEHDIVVA